MTDIPEAEARALLARQLYCHDIGEWSGWKLQQESVRAGMGLVDEQGLGVRLQVDLLFRRSKKTGTAHYIFTVFKQESYGLQRVYQLEVKQWARPVKDEHMRPHEHWGDSRVVGDKSWATWGFEQIIGYFCQQTGIVFQPAPTDPEAFELK